MSTKPAPDFGPEAARAGGATPSSTRSRLAAGATIIGAIALMAPLPVDPRDPVAGGRQRQLHHQYGVRHHRREQPALRYRAISSVVTVLSSIFALAIAVPIAIGIATFLTNYAPRRFARPFAILVDLLAAVPSIVFGLWGIFVLAPKLEPVATVPQREPGLVLPLRRRQCVAGGWRHHLHRGRRAGRDDPADHHLGDPGSLHA